MAIVSLEDPSSSMAIVSSEEPSSCDAEVVSPPQLVSSVVMNIASASRFIEGLDRIGMVGRRAQDAFGRTHDSALRYSDSNWKNSIQELTTFVAVKDGLDMGLLRCAPDTDNPFSVFLVSMWITPLGRREGLAEKLIQVSVEWEQSTGYRLILI